MFSIFGVFFCSCLDSSSQTFVLFCVRIFEIAPPAIGMFSFGPEFANDEEKLYKSEKFKRHAAGVVTMLDAAVNMLGPDMEPATKALTGLGAIHVAYGVLPAHYPIVGEALVHTLKTALGDGWTPLVAKGWTMIFGFVSTAMIAGARNKIEKNLRRKERIAQRKRKTKKPSMNDEEFNFDEVGKKEKEKAAKNKVPTEIGIEQTPDNDNHKTTSDIIVDLTGNKPSAPSKKMQKLSNLINETLVIDTTNSQISDDDLSLTSHASEPSDPQAINYREMVESVDTTWLKIKKIPNYAEVAGVLLFQK